MATSGDNVRFQVFINGERRGTGGFDKAGVLSVIVNWIRRDLSRVPEHVRADPQFTTEEWIGNYSYITLGGLNSDKDEHVDWFNAELKVGDEVTIKVLPPGEVDSPERCIPDSEVG